MESEREVNPNRAAGVTADEAHARINSLLDCIVELTRERDAARAVAGADIDDMVRQLDSAHEMNAELSQHYRELTAERDRWRDQANDDSAKYIAATERLASRLHEATNRALDEVISALAGWVEGARSNCLASEGCHCGGDQCGRVFHVDDIRNMVEDARRQLTGDGLNVSVPVADFVQRAMEAEPRDFDAVVDHCDGCATVRAERDEARAQVERQSAALNRQGDALAQNIRERDAYRAQLTREIERVNEVVIESQRIHKERDEAKSKLTEALTWLRSAEAERAEAQAKAERAEALMNSAHESHNRALEWLNKALAERDAERECRAQNEQWAVREQERADKANGLVADLRGVLISIVESLDRQEPK